MAERLPADRGRAAPDVVAAKARLTAGADMWSTNADAELEIPALRLSDGPSGVRGPMWDERHTARCTPCGTSLAASWDEDLVARVGQLIGDEARRQQVHVVLGPTLNIHRSPLGGRGFECYSEDPLLSGRMAAAWIGGVQSRGVAACPKHFVANDSETSRTRVDCVVDERALREIYLVPFEHAVNAGAWTVMAAYNRVNGIHATEHRELLRDLLKQEWRWDGLVISDWFAAHDTVASALAGLDLEMPGPARVFGERLARAVDDGPVPEAELDDKVESLRRLARRVTAAPSPARSEPCPGGIEELLTESAAAGFVLLKNAGALLPLLPGTFRSLAVIGPNAVRPSYQGGGSAEVNMSAVRPLAEVLADRFDGVATVRVEQGCPTTAFIGLHELLVEPGRGDERGVVVEYFAADDSELVTHREVRNSSLLAWHPYVPGMDPTGRGRVRVSGVLKPEVDGPHLFSVRGSGPTRLLVGGEELARLPALARLDDPVAAWFSDERGYGGIDLHAGEPVPVEVRMEHRPVGGGLSLLEYGCRPPEATDMLERAVSLARASDAVILVVGTARGEESESSDRTSTSLPAGQDRLVRSVLAANPRTVVVVNAGAAVDLPWADEAAAILYSWFPGDAFAEALASVVSGDREPGGRLPITLAARPEHYPAYDTTPDSSGALAYTESVFVGYRHFQAAGHAPAFAFGHGLGYTDFDYSSLTLSSDTLRAGESVTASVIVRNTGSCGGKEVVQLYVSPAPPGRTPDGHGAHGAIRRPPSELKAFAVVRLSPGESTRVALRLGSRAFAHWDIAGRRWRVEPGTYGIEVGRSSGDIRLRAGLGVPLLPGRTP